MALTHSWRISVWIEAWFLIPAYNSLALNRLDEVTLLHFIVEIQEKHAAPWWTVVIQGVFRISLVFGCSLLYLGRCELKHSRTTDAEEVLFGFFKNYNTINAAVARDQQGSHAQI